MEADYKKLIEQSDHSFDYPLQRAHDAVRATAENVSSFGAMNLGI